MSIYPSFTKTDDTSSEKLSIDLSNFVQSSNAVFDTDVYMKNGSKINYSGKISKAFGQDDEDMLLSCDDKLSKITYDDGTGTTTIKDTLDLSNASVIFKDESISISKITELSSTIDGIHEHLETINSNDLEVATLKKVTDDHILHLSRCDSYFDDQNIIISKINLDLMDYINPSITKNYDMILKNEDNLKILHDKRIENDMILIQQETRYGEMKIELKQLSVSEEATKLRVTEIEYCMDTFKSGMDDFGKHWNDVDKQMTSINTVNDKQNEDLVVLTDIMKVHEQSLDDIAKTNEKYSESLTDFNATTIKHSDTISNLQGLVGYHSERLFSIDDVIKLHKNDLANINTMLSTKQQIINSFKKLPVCYIGNGDVSNDKLSSLNDVSTTHSVQSQLDELAGVIAKLQPTTTDDTLSSTTLKTIEDNFEIIDNTKVDKSVFDKAINDINLKLDSL